MAKTALNHAWLQIASDLSSSMPGDVQYQRLVETIRAVLPCDAVTLMQLHDGALVPVAATGLAPELIGQRFSVDTHPRLQAILQAQHPVRFAADSSLPDPFDGWLAIDRERHANVHSCMGCSLWVNQQLVGALTFDALQPGLFDTITDTTIAGFAALAAATLHNVGLIRMLERSRAHQQELAQELVRDAHRREGTLIGKSAVIQQLRQHIDMVAHTELNVLILGETGTGKELVARTLHARSQRKNQPLVYINCAALPEQIAESELFGHVKGAFTGAIQTRAGKFELANHGTLFLDEIGELNISLQAKLLRALQQGEIQRVGADQPIQVDVRIIAATNRDLISEISKGNFRSDLYHRLNVFPIQVPALRDHTSDIPLLSSYFLEQARRKLALPQIGLHPDALIALGQYDWPGNVRELEHLLMRASLRAAGQNQQGKILIQPEHLDLPAARPAVRLAETTTKVLSTNDPITKEPIADDILHTEHQEFISLREAIDQFQRQLIQQTLELSHGNWSEAARRLQIDRANLSRLSLRLGIKG